MATDAALRCQVGRTNPGSNSWRPVHGSTRRKRKWCVINDLKGVEKRRADREKVGLPFGPWVPSPSLFRPVVRGCRCRVRRVDSARSRGTPHLAAPLAAPRRMLDLPRGDFSRTYELAEDGQRKRRGGRIGGVVVCGGQWTSRLGRVSTMNPQPNRPTSVLLASFCHQRAVPPPLARRLHWV